MSQTLARLNPFTPLRRCLSARRELKLRELALREAELEDARRRTADAITAVWDEAYAAGEQHALSGVT